MENSTVTKNYESSTTYEKSTLNYSKRQRIHINRSPTTDSFLDEVNENQTEELSIDNDNIPTYLISTNYSFEKMIQPIIKNMTNSINIEQLRQIAILMHQRTMIDLEKSLWLTYLKCGTGVLKTETKQNNFYHWPEILKKLAIQSLNLSMNKNSLKEITNDNYSSFVHTRLHRLDHQQQHYQTKLNEKMQHIDNYKTLIEPSIELFIQQNLQSIHANYELKIKEIGYEYEQQRLYFQIQKENLINSSLIKMIRLLCQRKYEHEKSKEEIILMKKYVQEKKLPASLQSIEIKVPSFLQTIHDPTVRQQLLDRHQKIIQEYQQEMLLIMIRLCEDYQIETLKLFDETMKKFWQDQRLLPKDERIKPSVLNLMEQQLQNITEKVQTTYQYRTKQLFDKI